MTRRQNTPQDLDPVVAAELAELERALGGDAGADPLLTDLVRETRASAPRFTGPARVALDERVRDGFPRPSRSAGLLARVRPSGLRLRPVLAVAAVAVAGVTVTTAALTGSETQDVSGLGAPVAQDTRPATDAGATATPPEAPDAARESAPQAAAGAPASSLPGPSGAAPSVASPAPAVPSAGAPGQRTRRVERSAALSLTARPDEVQGVADGVIRTAQGLGGIVASSRISTSPDGGEATLDLRIPTSRLDRAIADLSKLASVAGLDQDSQDITGAVVSATDRLQDARDERAALLKALGRAQTDRQVSSLRARIADSRRRIAAAQGDVQRLRARTDRATVTVLVSGDPSAGAGATSDEDGGGAWTPGDAAGDAWRLLQVAAGVAVIAAAALVPLGLLALLAWAAARTTVRRRRARALDAAA
ncbi:DUF4349 domain-containing protein [Conexibacter sp. W3-3-2]|uniref:DUF4349 domain-containing protein n=1 Tax=Conexibacter sp. W3-3-2 TaxID=2675227 RepID=UPI0012B819E7|nr:DUF4349 domain-containing protein [Conexibacter sp. W3-3-2]MTD45775.1 DUF4349 domain-containing protein [Conexibacter sp. W3-3-2]